MTSMKKKGKEGVAVEYITRNRALKKLQLPLNDFRRLCILKGIFPRDPKHKNKIGSTATNKKTVYLQKDINFLSHEPLLQSFRDLRSFNKRIQKYRGRGEWKRVDSLFKTDYMPNLSLDHLIRERYPSFSDALNDIDDALSMIALFASLPTSKEDISSSTISNTPQQNISLRCQKILLEFQAYLQGTGSLNKAFISIKGIYWQANINWEGKNHRVTWITPHEGSSTGYASSVTKEQVDFKVMMTFLDFYCTLLSHVLCRLHRSMDWSYPNLEDGSPSIQLGQEIIVVPGHIGKEDVLSEDRSLLKGKKIWIGRECPRKALSFLLQCMGARVMMAAADLECGHEDDVKIINGEECDPSIDYQISDRNNVSKIYGDRCLLQPQWAFDLLNAGESINDSLYSIGSELPNHLSPFEKEDNDVIDDENDVGDNLNDSVKEQVPDGISLPLKPIKATKKKSKSATPMTEEQKKLALSLLSKKKQKLYTQMQYSRQKDLEGKERLDRKRGAAKASSGMK